MAKALKPQIKEILKRPSVIQARKQAVLDAKESGKAFAEMGDAEGLDTIRKSLGKQITNATDDNEKRMLIQTQEDLTHIMEQIAPKLGEARAAFRADSAPINQSDVGVYLKNKLISALNEEGPQKANSFAGAVRDAPRTLKNSLGQDLGYTKLSQALTPEQNAAVESVREDLAREARDKLLAQKGAQAAPNALNRASASMQEATGGDKLVNPLSRIVTIANAIIDRMGNRIDKKLAIEIADEMLKPQAVAASMEKYMKKAEVAGKIKTATNKLINPIIFTGQKANNLAPAYEE